MRREIYKTADSAISAIYTASVTKQTTFSPSDWRKAGQIFPGLAEPTPETYRWTNESPSRVRGLTIIWNIGLTDTHSMKDQCPMHSNQVKCATHAICQLLTLSVVISELRDSPQSSHHHVWQESSDQERWHVRGDAAGRRGLCHPGPQEVQHWEGHRCLHQEGVWQEVQPHLALHCWQELWVISHPCDQALHLHSSWPSCHSPLQEWIRSQNCWLLCLYHHPPTLYSCLTNISSTLHIKLQDLEHVLISQQLQCQVKTVFDQHLSCL